jgi:para-aminobenzoate synthetase component 1
MAYYILKQYKLNTPILDIFSVVAKQNKPFFLDSSLNSKHALGRFSFLGFEPFYIYKANRTDPFNNLRIELGRFKLNNISGIPFFGGAVGYLSYDLGLVLEEKLQKRYNFKPIVPDCFFAFYNKVIIIDHFKKIFYLLSLGFPERSNSLAKSLAKENFNQLYSLIKNIDIKGKEKEILRKSTRQKLKSNFTKEEYFSAVKKTKAYIRSGDIYQLNLSQQFKAYTDLSSEALYRRLRQISPSFFSAYFDAGDFQIISSSPESFLRVKGALVLTRPMKGTRPRSRDRKEDNFLRKELLRSTKDKAELMMIVDLERNDLGRVCRHNSVRVKKIREIEEYNTVFQTTATLEGRLNRDKDRLDLLRACFPGGSITGCPKIRAMEIINELENTPRSIYTGSLGYLSFCGNMDFNILIRTILKKDNRVNFGVGGGIVADSIPEDEYEETLIKAKAILKALSIGDENGEKRNNLF